MDWRNRRSVETRIKRLTKEIAEIESSFYGLEREKDRVLVAATLERKRDDIVRSAVLQLHTSIEDLLNLLIPQFYAVFREERHRARIAAKAGRGRKSM